MTVNDIKMGEKFIVDGNPYLRINMNVNNMVPFTDFSSLICVLDLNTYKVVCLNGSTEVANT